MRVIEIKKFCKGHLMNSITELYITVNGPKMVIEMEKELKFGKMGVNLLVIGEMTKLTVKEDSFMLMVTFMKEIGLTIKLKEEEHMSIWTVLNTWVNGEKIVNTDMESRVGQIMQNMKVITSTVRNTASVLSNGVMDHLTSVNFTIIIFMVKVCIHGQTTEFTKVNGDQIKCMGKELSHGLTGVNMLENMLKTKNVDMENSFGLMVDATEANGSMESNTEKEHT